MPIHISKEDLERVTFVTNLILQNYRYYYTPQQLAAKANTNESKLRRIFKEVHNHTIHNFYIIVKVEKAKELLKETEIPINEIARRVGLELRTFNRQFKKTAKMSPNEWRIKHVYRNEEHNRMSY